MSSWWTNGSFPTGAAHLGLRFAVLSPASPLKQALRAGRSHPDSNVGALLRLVLKELPIPDNQARLPRPSTRSPARSHGLRQC